MKKLMTAVAIVCAATFSQAASVDWGAGVYDGVNFADVEAGQMAYLVYSASAMELATKLTIDGETMTLDNGGSIVASYALSDYDAHEQWAFGQNWARDDANGGVNGYYQIILANEAGNAFAVIDAGQVTGASDSTGAGSAVVAMDWDDATTYLGGVGYTGTIVSESIPEPTSGLLLLLGMAGLALRRKQA